MCIFPHPFAKYSAAGSINFSLSKWLMLQMITAVSLPMTLTDTDADTDDNATAADIPVQDAKATAVVGHIDLILVLLS